MKSSYAKKIDANQVEIVKALRKAGAWVGHVHAIPNFFDILVIHKGRYYCVEIKDGNNIPSKRRLTAGELKCKEQIEQAGGVYHVVESVEQALSMIGEK